MVVARHLCVLNEPGIEIEPQSVAIRRLTPEFNELHRLPKLVAPRQICLGVVRTIAFRLQNEQALDARASLFSARDLVVIKSCRIVLVADDIDVRSEGIDRVEYDLPQAGYQSLTRACWFSRVVCSD
jgi:hypothetical protein